MGMMQQRAWALLILFASATFNPCRAADEVTLEMRPWPAPRNCDACIPIQFGKLEMRLPISEIGKILVAGSGDSILHILPNAENAREGLLFMTVTPDRLMNVYRSSGLLKNTGISTNEQLFDAMGKPPGTNKSLAAMRRIEHLDTAQEYLKASKEGVHVYWIKSSIPGGSQRVYFVLEGERQVYMLAGNITSVFYEATLSNLHIVDVP